MRRILIQRILLQRILMILNKKKLRLRKVIKMNLNLNLKRVTVRKRVRKAILNQTKNLVKIIEAL